MPPKSSESTEAIPAPRRSARNASAPPSEAGKSGETKPKGTKRAANDDAKEASGTTKKSKKDDSKEDKSDETKLKAIEIGDSLPSFVLKNEKEEDVDVLKLTEEKGVVFFLVPKADTPGCTTQACGYRDIYPDFTDSGFDVYCLSADTPQAQKKWQTKKELPYPLLSDKKRQLIGALGAADGAKTKRSHFIFEKGGKLVDKKNPVKAGDSPKLALEFIKSLKK